MGLVEVVRLDADEPADPGELGRLVVTPYFPYRDCMPVFRYDTQDLVRRLPGGPTSCSLAGIPAVSALQGKAGQLIRTPAGPVTPRDIIEILESLPTQPWPARYRATLRDGMLLIELPLSAMAGLTTGEVATRFAARGHRLRDPGRRRRRPAPARPCRPGGEHICHRAVPTGV